MTTVTDHDSYIAAAPEAFRPILDHLRDQLRQALPDAEEMTAYNMPGFSIQGKVVASYAAFSKQVGVYFLAPALSAHADEIAAAGLKATKTGVTFTPRKPIPDDLVIRLAQSSREHADD
ncbi:MAG: iron chaperone [Pseudoclavibacter sp.]